MIHNLLLSFLTYTALMIQVTLSHRIEIHSIQINYLVAVLLVICLQSGNRQALIWAACIGFLIDTISSGDLGVVMICTILCTGMMPASWFNGKKISFTKYSIRAFILCSFLLFSILLLKQSLAGVIQLNPEILLKTLKTCLHTILCASLLRQTGIIIQRFTSKGSVPVRDQESIYI